MTATLSKTRADRRQHAAVMTAQATEEFARVVALVRALDGALDEAVLWDKHTFTTVFQDADDGDWWQRSLFFLRDCLARSSVRNSAARLVEDAADRMAVVVARTEGGAS